MSQIGMNMMTDNLLTIIIGQLMIISFELGIIIYWVKKDKTK